MNKVTFPVQALLLSAVLLSLSACPGSGSDDSDDTVSPPPPGPVTLSPAEVRSEEAALAATTTAGFAIANQNAPLVGGAMSLAPKNKSFSAATGDVPNKGVETKSESEPGQCGGLQSWTSTVTTPDTPGVIVPLTIAAHGVWDNFCIGQTNQNITFNGTYDTELHYETLGNGHSSLDYDTRYTTNLPFSPTSGRIVFSQYCTIINNVSSCERATRHRASSGVNYSLRNFSVSGNGSSGYRVNGSLLSSTNRQYNVVASGLTSCSNGNFQTGNIQITDQSDNTVVSIHFSNCTQAVITYLGNSWTITR